MNTVLVLPAAFARWLRELLLPYCDCASDMICYVFSIIKILSLAISSHVVATNSKLYLML